ncbi:MAG: hypothetical protein KDD47_07490 [Acidobacteria bacterium]|nr:hypothetical protein [Acidobacteriota bacterium]
MYKFLAGLFAILSLALAALWQWGQHKSQQELVRAVTSAEESRAAAEARQAASRLEALSGEAEAVAQAFASGLFPDLVTERIQDLDVAVAELMHLDRVLFVHLMGVDGGVLATSDRKVLETGQVGSRALWALEVTALTRREGATADSAEVAVPIESGGARVAVLLLGYDLR